MLFLFAKFVVSFFYALQLFAQAGRLYGLRYPDNSRGSGRLAQALGPRMQFLRWLAITAISVAVSLTSSCTRQAEPLSALNGQPLRAISVEDITGYKVTLTSHEDLEFVTSHLTGLEVRREFKISHEFNLDFYPPQGAPLRLRLGENHVGPDVPASAMADRWYFKDRTLYEFIKSKARAIARP